MIKLREILLEQQGYQYKEDVPQRSYSEEDDTLMSADYLFNTDKHKYRVTITSFEYNSDDKEYDLVFGVDRGIFNAVDTLQLTNEGNIRAIIATLSNIIYQFITEHKANIIHIEGTDDKRKRVYKALFPKYLDPSIRSKVHIS